MIGDPKEKKEYLDKLLLSAGKKGRGPRFGGFRLYLNMETLFQLIGMGLQIVLGLGVVAISMLGLIQPLWISMVFTILGSCSTMAGVYSAYRFFAFSHAFDSLIQRAARRAIESQN